MVAGREEKGKLILNLKFQMTNVKTMPKSKFQIDLKFQEPHIKI